MMKRSRSITKRKDSYMHIIENLSEKINLQETAHILGERCQHKLQYEANWILAKGEILCCFLGKSLYLTDINFIPFFMAESTSYISGCGISHSGKYVVCQMGNNHQNDEDSGATALIDTEKHKIMQQKTIEIESNSTRLISIDEYRSLIHIYVADRILGEGHNFVVKYDFNLQPEEKSLKEYYRKPDISPYALNARVNTLITKSQDGNRDWKDTEPEILALLERLKADTKMSHYQLADTYKRLGDIYVLFNETEKAITSYETGLLLYGRLPVKKKLNSLKKLNSGKEIPKPHVASLEIATNEIYDPEFKNYIDDPLKNKAAKLTFDENDENIENNNSPKMTPTEMQEALAIKKEIQRLQEEKSVVQKAIDELNQTIKSKNDDISSLEKTIILKKQQIVSLDEEILVQEFGLYSPKFDFANALGYKEALSKNREKQKALIKNKMAITGNTNWTVNGNASQGKKMVTDTQKLLLRAFNSECDELVNKVKYTNFDASLNRIQKSASAISKLGTIMNIAITPQYLSLKKDELHLAFEYQCKKQQEKEEAKEARAEQREQAKIQRELEEQKRKIEKEQAYYQTAYEKLMAQLSKNPDNVDLQKKKESLESQLSDIDMALTDIDYRQANMRAGYVYIISNIGSFGENIYKIGMTRRLDPQERIDELGGASVPFKFDVHAMIFSDDAPALEAALHRAFEDKKVNMVNQRREFFNVTLDEIKDVVRKNFDKTVEFIDIPDAEQYRISMKTRNMPAINEIANEKTKHIINNTSAVVNNKRAATEYLYTKWGIYEMPDPYKVQIQYGARTDLKEVKI